MTDEPPRNRLKDLLRVDKTAPAAVRDADIEGAEARCEAFGYLRGLREMASSVEFRFRDGNSIWFPYGLLGPWQHNPSEGLLLKFSGDLIPNPIDP